MYDAAQACLDTNKINLSPRDFEVDLLSKASAHLESIQNDWATEDWALHSALYYNRQQWMIFLGLVSDKKNPLPADIKNDIASLGIFVLNHTIDIQNHPCPEKLSSLININRDVASRLHSKINKN